MAKNNILEMNELRDAAFAEFRALRRDVDNKYYNQSLNKEKIDEVFELLDEKFEKLQSSIPAKGVRVDNYKKEVSKLISEIKKELNQEITNRVVSRTKELIRKVDDWAYLVEFGVNPSPIALEAESKEVSKLKEQLETLKEFMSKYSMLANKQATQIAELKKEVAELKEKITDPDEDDVLAITQLVTVYNADLKQIKDLEAYCGRLTECASILKSVVTNIELILSTSSEKSELFIRAKHYLDSSKYEDMFSNPEEALSVYKNINTQIAKLTVGIVPKVTTEKDNLTPEQQEALNIRNQLINEKKAKEVAKSAQDLNDVQVEPKETVLENK